MSKIEDDIEDILKHAKELMAEVDRVTNANPTGIEAVRMRRAAASVVANLAQGLAVARDAGLSEID